MRQFSASAISPTTLSIVRIITQQVVTTDAVAALPAGLVVVVQLRRMRTNGRRVYALHMGQTKRAQSWVRLITFGRKPLRPLAGAGRKATAQALA